LLKASATQVTSFADTGDSGIYASTSNLGKVFLLGAAPEAEGSYESDIFDARIFSRWGRAEFRGAGNVELLARSGNVDNPDRNWSPWKKVDLRKDGEARWLLLKDNLTDKFYSFDASLLPDGGYTIKVVASDSPSHSPEQALTAEKESARFEVDTTPPQIQNLTAGVDGGKIHVNFR